MEQETNEKSVFVEYFGDSAQIKILDFLIQGQDLDYSMTEIARGSSVGWSAFTRVWQHLLKKNIIAPTRTIGNAKLFKLNKENPAVQKLIKLDLDITKLETDKLFEQQGWIKKASLVKN
jgi:hypothetical protein